MSAQSAPHSGALLAGGQGRLGSSPAAAALARGARLPGRAPAASIVAQEPAAEGSCGRPVADVRTAAGSWKSEYAGEHRAGVDAAGGGSGGTAVAAGDRGGTDAAAGHGCGVGHWPEWALPQLGAAFETAGRTPPGAGAAVHLYRDWFSRPLVPPADLPSLQSTTSLAGICRAAHAGRARRVSRAGGAVVDRDDVVGRDGWWRTRGGAWSPPRERRLGVRLVLSPRPDRLGVVVRMVTEALLDVRVPWSLACATSPRRARRTGAVVVDLPAEGAVPRGLVAALEPVLVPQTPPLCLPLGAGAALAGHPGNGMTFGEHRCHLIALALRHVGDAGPLAAVATVFDAHGIDPAVPHRYKA